MAEIFNPQFIKLWQGRLYETFLHLLKNWYFLILATLISGCIGYYFINKVKPTYTATISFVLSTDQKASNPLAGLAAQLGFDASTTGSENIFSGDNIIELFKSRKLIGKALLSEVDAKTHESLIDYMIKIQQGPAQQKNIPFPKDPSKYNSQETALYRKCISSVAGKFTVFKKDKKLIFYIISATTVDANLSYYLSKYMLQETSNFFIDIKTKTAASSLRLLKNEADTLGMILSQTYRSTANTIDRSYNLNPSITIQRSGALLNQAKVAAYGAAYTEVMRNLEIAKINLQKETPLYRIIDEPEMPLGAQKPNILRHVILTTFIGIFLMTCLLISEKLIKFLF